MSSSICILVSGPGCWAGGGCYASAYCRSAAVPGKRCGLVLPPCGTAPSQPQQLHHAVLRPPTHGLLTALLLPLSPHPPGLFLLRHHLHAPRVPHLGEPQRAGLHAHAPTRPHAHMPTCPPSLSLFQRSHQVLVVISITNDVSVVATSFDKVQRQHAARRRPTRRTCARTHPREQHAMQEAAPALPLLPHHACPTVRPASAAAAQVHSSDVPETFNITKLLAVACAISFTGVGSLVLLFALAEPTKLNWWPSWWGLELDSEEGLGHPIITNVRGRGKGGGSAAQRGAQRAAQRAARWHRGATVQGSAPRATCAAFALESTAWQTYTRDAPPHPAQLRSRPAPPRVPLPLLLQGQTIACLYLGLTCFIQLSILLTRNPSFWWHFSKKGWVGQGANKVGGRVGSTYVGAPASMARSHLTFPAALQPSVVDTAHHPPPLPPAPPSPPAARPAPPWCW